MAWLADQEDFVDAIVSATSEDVDIGMFAIDEGLAFEVYAEAGRNQRVHAAVQRNYAEVHAALVRQILTARARGKIDPALDAAGAATLITAVFDGLTIAGLCAANFDAEAVARTLPFLFERFLRPGIPPAVPAGPRRARTRRNVSR